MSSNNGAPLDGKFNQFYNDLVTNKSTLGHATVNIYTDAAGTTHALDNNGNHIKDSLINYTIYTYGSDFMPSSNASVGNMRIVLKGGSRLSVENSLDPAYWYSFDNGATVHPLH